MNYNSNQMSQTFGEWLLAARKSAKLTQEKVAEKSEVSKAYIGHLENDRPHSTTGAKLTPAREKVVALAKAVNGNVNEALSLAGYLPEQDDKIPDFIKHIDFSIFSETELNEIASFIKFKAAQKEITDINWKAGKTPYVRTKPGALFEQAEEEIKKTGS